MARWTSRFRRTISLGGGFRLNFTKRGVGVSAGTRGLRRSWHSTGHRTTSIGLPGTGLFWQKIERVNTTRVSRRARQPDQPPAGGGGENETQDLVDLARRAQREIEKDR